MLTRQGVWTSVEMTIPMSSIKTGADNDIVVTDVIIFVALGDPVDAGLKGTLSLCYVPTSDDWSQVSIFQHAMPEIPWNYITYGFEEKMGQYSGWLEFEYATDKEGSLTLGGQIIVQDQLSDNLFQQTVVNPFLQIDLEQLSFRHVLL